MTYDLVLTRGSGGAVLLTFTESTTAQWIAGLLNDHSHAMMDVDGRRFVVRESARGATTTPMAAVLHPDPEPEPEPEVDE